MSEDTPMKIETHAEYLARLEREREARKAYWLNELRKLKGRSK